MPEFVDPNQILNNLSLKNDMTAADFGCGSGGWTIPLAKRLENGKVFAVDVLEEPLSALKSKATHEGVTNIVRIIADVEEEISQIPPFSCDLVLMTDLLFQVDDKKAVFKQAKRVLKSGGKVLVVEWNQNAPFAPSGGKPSPQEVKEIARESGFVLEREFPAGDYHFGLIFKKI